MPNLVTTYPVPSLSLYGIVLDAAGQAWTGSAFESLQSAHWATYAAQVALTDAAGVGLYAGTFPATITTPGLYSVVAYRQAGGSPAVTDPPVRQFAVAWSGAAEVVQSGDSYARLGAPAGASVSADIQTRSTYAGADTAGTTTLLSRLTGTRAGLLDNLDAAMSTRGTYSGGNITGNLSGSVGAVAGAVTVAAGGIASPQGFNNTGQTTSLPVGTGSGPYAVNHGGGVGAGSVLATLDVDNAGTFAAWGTDGLRYTSDGATGVQGVTVRVYLKSAFDASTGTGLAASTVTKSDGRWASPVYLSSGDYYVVASYPGDESKTSRILVP